MGFDPQNANEPIVNFRKRTTKVNIATVVAVVIFLAAGILSLRWVANRTEGGEPPRRSETAPAS